MTTLFLTVVNLSITGSFVILFVLAARLLLKCAPKVYSYAMWSAALFRLLVPFSMESAFSLLPVKPSPIPQKLATSTNPYEWTVNSGVTVVDNVVNPVLYEASPGAMNSKLTVLAALWLMGVLLMAGYSLLSLFRLTRQLRDADHVQDNIYCSQRISTAFVLGLVRPKIYLPAGLSGQERAYILLHEQTHIHRKDHWIKVLSFIALCIHWFDPLVWLAFFLSAQDMEMACDEAVVKKMGPSIKKDYSLSLLSLASGRRLVGGSPLAFGEGDTKGRIKNILRFKKPAVWAAGAAAILVLAAVLGLMTSRPTEDGEALADQAIASIHKRDNIALSAMGLEFTIPDCKSPEDFNILIHGRRKIGDDFMSVHLLEELNDSRSWEAGKTYLIPISGGQYESLMMSVYLDSVPNLEKTVDLLEIWGPVENEPAQTEEPAVNAFAVKFPAYDQRTEYNGKIMDVEPFYLCMTLSEGWTIKERPESETRYPLMGAWTPLGVYNEAGDCIGSVAYNIYEEIPESNGNPMAIYNQVALGNHYSFDCHDSYQVVNETEQGETAVTEVYISQMLSQEPGLRRKRRGEPGHPVLRPGAAGLYRHGAGQPSRHRGADHSYRQDCGISSGGTGRKHLGIYRFPVGTGGAGGENLSGILCWRICTCGATAFRIWS